MSINITAIAITAIICITIAFIGTHDKKNK
jgi:hypothetical protein